MPIFGVFFIDKFVILKKGGRIDGAMVSSHDGGGAFLDSSRNESHRSGANELCANHIAGFTGTGQGVGTETNHETRDH